MGAALVDRLPAAFSPVAECDHRSRVSAAALTCMARFGLGKTTVDDIAREARLSRATVYRVFPGGREEIVATAVSSEVERYFAALGAVLAAESELEGLLVAALSAAADQLASHGALASLLANEPEVVVSYLAFSGFDMVLGAAGEFLVPYLAPYLAEREARRVGQWLARLVTSYVACPHFEEPRLSGSLLPPPRAAGGSRFALHPEPIGREEARRLVRQFVLPGIAVLQDSSKEPN